MRPDRRLWLLMVVVSAASSQQLLAEATFTKDIAPLIFEKCTSCHRPGEAAPFALQTYADVKKRSDLIASVVSERLMPPWKADRSDAAFLYERRLEDDQVTLITDWIKNGMPEGNPTDMPPLPEFPIGWSLGEPDLIVKMKEPFTVPADGPDIYRNFVIPLELDSERWVTAIDFRPSARSVVHHSLFFFEATGLARKIDAEDQQPGFKGGMGAMARLRGGPPVLTPNASETEPGRQARRQQPGAGLGFFGDQAANEPPKFGPLGGWALGAQPHPLPDGLAFRLPAGSDLILATHFHPSGKAEEEASTVGLYFAKEPTKRRFTAIQLPTAFGAFKGINIAPGTKEYVVEESFELPVDVEAFGVGAHAHYLGKSMKLTATLPDGQTQTLLSISDWDFAWQEQYRFANYVKLPKGTRLHSRITYDNSADNPRNPSHPPARVRFGEESTNEMASITLQVIAAQESEMPKLIDGYRVHFRKSVLNAPIPLLRMLQGGQKSD